jgi:hypothetical protein
VDDEALLPLGPDAGGFVFEELHVNDIWRTTDGAVFDIVLRVAAGGIERDDDLFAAVVAEVTPFGEGIAASGGTAAFATRRHPRNPRVRGLLMAIEVCKIGRGLSMSDGFLLRTSPRIDVT